MLRKMGEMISGEVTTSLTKIPYLELEVDNKKIRYANNNKHGGKRIKSLFSKEPLTIPWLETMKAGEVFVDIGANVGMYSIYAAAYAGVQVYSFEPESQNYAELNKNIFINGLNEKISAYCLALSNEKKFSHLLLSDFGPAFAHHDFGGDSWKGDKLLGNKVFKKQDRIKQGCYSISLDELIATGVVPAPQHIKIDVDGIESRIIAGAENVLRGDSLKTILIEVDFDIEESVKIIDLMLNWGWRFSKDQVRINQHEIVPYEVFEKRLEKREGGSNFIFYKDAWYDKFFSDFSKNFIAPNPLRPGQDQHSVKNSTESNKSFIKNLSSFFTNR